MEVPQVDRPEATEPTPLESATCPQCGSSVLLIGTVVGADEGGPSSFVPYGTQPAASVPLSYGSLCCLTCGLLWTRVSLAQVRKAIERHGTAITKELFIILEAGPYHDLPDLPEARRAADGVFEINRLMLDDRQPAATRRFRELTRTTWDQAIDAVRHWGDIDRNQKLALFGWQSKEVCAGGDPELRDHPMRDRLLDG